MKKKFRKVAKLFHKIANLFCLNYSSENYVNTYCQEYPEHCQNSLSFQHILIVYMDGLPYDQFWTSTTQKTFKVSKFTTSLLPCKQFFRN